MSKFVSANLKTITFEDGEWIKLPEEISFADVQKINSDPETDSLEKSLNLMIFFIKEWHLSENGQPVELTKDNIKRLSLTTIKKIQEEIVKIMPTEEGKKKESAS